MLSNNRRDNCDYTTPARRSFKRWLLRLQYDSCVEAYPAAIHAITLVDEYLREYPDYVESKPMLERYAERIGWISDYQNDDYADDDAVW